LPANAAVVVGLKAALLTMLSVVSRAARYLPRGRRRV